MQIKGPIKVETEKEGKTAYQKLIDMMVEKGKKVKLEVPFAADKFKSEKQPKQPDGITPITIEKANLIPSVVKPKEAVKKKSKTKKEVK